MTERLYAQIAALLREQWDIPRLTRLRAVHKGRHGAGFEVVRAEKSLLLLLVDHMFSPSAIETGARVMRHATDCGYPVPALHATSSGRSAVRGVEGRHALLMDFPEGRAVSSDAMTPRVAATWGERLASCHAALAEYADPALPAPSEVNPGSAGERFRESFEPGGPPEPVMLGAMADAAAAGAARTQELTCQPTHGDFSRHAILFDGTGAVSAVLDWMSVEVRPRSVELLDAVALLCRRGDGILDMQLANALIEAYQHVLPLSNAETQRPVAVRLAWFAAQTEIGPTRDEGADERERLACLWGARREVEDAIAGTHH